MYRETEIVILPSIRMTFNTIMKFDLAATLLLLLSLSSAPAIGQATQQTAPEQSPQLQTSPLSTSPAQSTVPNPTSSLPTAQPLFNFKDSDIKFSLSSLMNILRDSKHEGWVLAAYPDPKTSRPLIGAGFGLDVVATDHPQRDPLNPHLFLEPSSAQLWQAAGLNPELLQSILTRFDHDLEVWKKKKYRKKTRTHALSPQITEEEATKLLRISTIQAVENAKAYCRNFDQLTGPQQMALSQLVFQMGVNLEEFVQFLSALNGDIVSPGLSPPPQNETEDEHWKTVQRTLIDSEWARRYTVRATTVIAMFDPDYLQNPGEAEREIQAVLRPPPKHHHKKTPAKSSNSHAGKAPVKKRSASQPGAQPKKNS